MKSAPLQQARNIIVILSTIPIKSQNYKANIETISKLVNDERQKRSSLQNTFNTTTKMVTSKKTVLPRKVIIVVPSYVPCQFGWRVCASASLDGR